MSEDREDWEFRAEVAPQRESSDRVAGAVCNALSAEAWHLIAMLFIANMGDRF